MMKRTVRNTLAALLLLVFLGNGIGIAYRFIEYHRGNEIYAEAEALAGLPDLSGLPFPSLPSGSNSPSGEPHADDSQPVYVDPYADALRNMDFSALQEVNQDVLGWILIPGTNISYPVVQSSDNNYYLNRTWRKSSNSVGAIFLECKNSRDLSDFHTIIYGHRMNNRSMFGTLHNYKAAAYWTAHPYIYLTDQSGSAKYEIFSAYEAGVDSDTYLLGFSSEKSKQSFLNYCMEQSVIDTGIVPTVYDQILTLSTCTQNGDDTRWVIQAVRKGIAPAQTDEPPEPLPDPDPSPALSDVAPDGNPSADLPTDEDVSPDASHTETPQESPISQDIRPENTPGF